MVRILVSIFPIVMHFNSPLYYTNTIVYRKKRESFILNKGEDNLLVGGEWISCEGSS